LLIQPHTDPHPQQLVLQHLQQVVETTFINLPHQVQLLSREKQVSHFAKVENGKVVQVIVAEQDVIDSGIFGHGWVQTSYNTHGGVHATGGTPLRKNYAGIGYTYDEQRDAFIPPQPYASWALNEETCLWESPIAMPTEGGPFVWNEETKAWDAIDGNN
jgi:hypothetical protein